MSERALWVAGAHFLIAVTLQIVAIRFGDLTIGGFALIPAIVGGMALGVGIDTKDDTTP